MATATTTMYQAGLRRAAVDVAVRAGRRPAAGAPPPGHSLFLFLNTHLAAQAGASRGPGHAAPCVLVSPTFRLEKESLAQIGAHRPGNRPRPDHHVPFLVLSGIERAEDVRLLQHRLAEPYDRPLGKRADKAPLRLDKAYEKAGCYTGWSVPPAVQAKVLHLCHVLSSPNRGLVPFEEFRPGDMRRASEPEHEDGEQGRPARGNWIAHWARDEYKHLIDHHDLLWPEFLDHQPLTLFKNRYPTNPTISAYDPVAFRDTRPVPVARGVAPAPAA